MSYLLEIETNKAVAKTNLTYKSGKVVRGSSKSEFSRSKGTTQLVEPVYYKVSNAKIHSNKTLLSATEIDNNKFILYSE